MSALHRACKANTLCVAPAVGKGPERHSDHLQDIRGAGDWHNDGAAKGQHLSEGAAAGHGRYLLLVIDGTWRQAKEMYKVACPASFPQCGSSCLRSCSSLRAFGMLLMLPHCLSSTGQICSNAHRTGLYIIGIAIPGSIAAAQVGISSGMMRV